MCHWPHPSPFIFGPTLIVLICFVANIRFPNLIPTTRQGALDAISQIADWAKWMSGIQSATIGALGILVFHKDFEKIRNLTDWELLLSFSGFSCLGAAIFLSAWVLGALPSLTLRVHANPEHLLDTKNDVYELPLFEWGQRLKVGYALSLNHWLWGAGLASLGFYVFVQMKSS